MLGLMLISNHDAIVEKLTRTISNLERDARIKIAEAEANKQGVTVNAGK